jgi:protein-S-isoprenylcysteine O-methyltransferase Ste14
VILNSAGQATVTFLILGGTGLFLYIYHVRTRRFDASNRKSIRSWRAYQWVDWYLKGSTLFIALAATYSNHLLLVKLHHSLACTLLGLTIAGLAILLFAAAMRSLDAQYTPAHRSHLPTCIVRTGPYRYIRHPVYTSNLILLCGMFLFSGSAWMLVNLVILITYYVPTILTEEAAIMDHLPEYRDYAKGTGRFFPRL